MAIPAAQGGRGVGAWGPEMEFLKSDGAWAHGIDPKKPLSPLEFFRIYAGHYAVLLYTAIVVVTGAPAIKLATSWWQFFGSLLLVAVVYPIVEFCLHKFVLHSKALYRRPFTAALWRRIHYDH